MVNIEETGELSDKRIQEITILNKNNEKGYAKQNGLIVGRYINIIFGGELPTIITGEITNLEEDMIEVKTIPNDELIYIDFEYKRGDILIFGSETNGVPQNIHLTVEHRLNIPLTKNARSLNIAQTSAMVTGEALRQLSGFPN